MDAKQINDTLVALSRQQGFYGRLLKEMGMLEPNKDRYNANLNILAEREYKDKVDMVLDLETNGFDDCIFPDE